MPALALNSVPIEDTFAEAFPMTAARVIVTAETIGWARIAGQTATGSVDVFVSKYDFDGHVIWTRQFGTAKYDDALGIAVSGPGIYVMTSAP